MLDDVFALVGVVFCIVWGVVHIVFYRRLNAYYFRSQNENNERMGVKLPWRKPPNWTVRMFGILFCAGGVGILVGNFHLFSR